MYSQSLALALLDNYQPTDENEIKAHAFISKFVSENPRYWSRQTLTGHLTASAWITNAEQTHAVLLHHRKLDLWVQPGGHIDDDDETLPLASLREATEETGLKDLTLKQTSIFDLDVHAIPGRKNEPEHWHLDIRFWFVSAQGQLVINAESNELAWLSRAEIEQKTDEESVLRMVRKTLY